MHSSSKTDIKDVQKCFMNIDFGVVPVGSVHKKSIDITNNLKASIPFKIMYAYCCYENYNCLITYYQ